MSRLFDNSVSYFNAYYNAKRIFDEAEEAVITAERAARGKAATGQRTTSLPATVRDKFNAVIDKCSSILSFYPQSALVDDALFLIGKSYYYQQDYLKAERKFSELVVQFPNSPLMLESQLWLGRALEKSNNDEAARAVLSQLAETAVEQDELDLAAEAHALLGSIAEKEQKLQTVIEHYSKAIELTGDKFLTATLHAKIGDLYFSLPDYEKAIAAYIKVYDRVSDPYLSYYSRMQAAKGYVVLKRYDSALYLIEEMLDDIRYGEYQPVIQLEFAHVLLISGHTNDALEEYQFLDTTYARTETGANAAYALAQYHETKGDYVKARLYHVRAAAVTAAEISLRARRREGALGRVLSFQRQLAINDSLIVLTDSLQKYPENFYQAPEQQNDDSLAAGQDTSASHLLEPIAAVDSATVSPDTLQASGEEVAQQLEHQVDDSVVARHDTSAARRPEPRLTIKPVNIDSMRVVNARIAYDLAEVYYSDIEIPDSALAWFQRALDWKVDSTRVPRARFILAELGRTTNTNTELEIAEQYRQIIRDYPSSVYADEARKVLGLPVTVRDTQEDDRAYAVAESLLWAGQYDGAIERLKA
ncbi:MAG: tetratricopeptide repeat protein, partial [Bacteroidota bacterium]